MKEETSSLGQQAFTVVCDEAARDLLVKNTAIRTGNSALKPVEEQLYSLQIRKRNGEEDLVMFECDIRSYDADEEDEAMSVVAFSSDDSIAFPLSDLPGILFRIAGATVNTGLGWFGKCPHLCIDHDCGVISISVNYSEDIKITGKVENYDGTLEDIQRLVDTIRISLHWRSLDAIDIRTGQPSRFAQRLTAMGEGYLDNATFHFEQIKIPETLLTPLIWLSNPNTAYGGHLSTVESSGIDGHQNLDDLTDAMPSHKELWQVRTEHKILIDENTRLLQVRDRFQTLSLVSSDGSINFRLENGRRGTFCNSNQAAWTIESNAFDSGASAEEATVHLTSVLRTQPLLSGIPVGGGIGGNHSFLDDGVLLVVPYGASIEAVYMFHDLEGLNGTIFENFFAHVNATLLNGDGHTEQIGPNMTFGMPEVRIMVEGQAVSPLPSLKVRLLWVSIRFETIKRHLDLLGIDTAEENGPTDEEVVENQPEEGTEE